MSGTSVDRLVKCSGGLRAALYHTKGYKMGLYNKKTRKTFAIVVCVILVLALVAPLVIAITNL